jgi:hypothetical protein
MTAVAAASRERREIRESARRRRFIERMEQKLQYKTDRRQQRHKQFRIRLQRLRDW